jgi:uncharacterized protein (DUF58 family)
MGFLVIPSLKKYLKWLHYLKEDMLTRISRYLKGRSSGRKPVNSRLEFLYPDFDELVALKDRKAHIRLSAEHSIQSTIPGDHHSPFRGQGLEFDSVREYVAGDDVRSIDWRVTARTGSPHVKLFREERERQVIFCVDMNATMRFGTKNTFKSVQAARVASLLGWRTLSDHDRVGACLFGDVAKGIQYFEPRRTRKSHWSMLKILSEPPEEHHVVGLDEALRHVNRAAQTGSLIYVISDFTDLGEELGRALSRLNKRCDVVCIAINDPADAAMMPVGALEFQGSDFEKVAVNTESLEGRKQYTLQWEKNRQRLNECMSRAKVSMIELTTEMDVHRGLILGMRAISHRRSR